ncbi:MAG: GHKL domain-containing protein [Lachnospiraceae bacterium]|jgi:two-component system sensor histidine kinase AgrC|nr:GHKL domain-containing protein [Lachnospiraceae bacterium]
MAGKRAALIGLLIAALWGGAAVFILSKGPHHVGMGVELTSQLLLVLLVRFLGQVPVSRTFCLTLSPLMAVQVELLYQYVYHSPAKVLVLLLDIILLLICSKKSVKEHYLGLSVTGIAAQMMLFGYDRMMNRLMPFYYRLTGQWGLDGLLKSVLIGTVGILFFSAFVLCLRMLGRILTRWRSGLERMAGKLKGVELYVLILVIFSLILFNITEYGALEDQMWQVSSGAVTWMQFGLIFIDIFYIGLLVRTVSIREKMCVARNDKNMVSAYNAELETTLDRMHEIRHDMKNLFLTMGGFVERSGDEEMKIFYRRNIVPFMDSALVRNGLQAKLRVLRDDCLKSFLYYKIIEKTEQGIPVTLTVVSPVGFDGGYGDLVRILGILMDNAAEEAKLAKGSVDLRITEDHEGITIRVENDVRPQAKKRGVIPGVTDKGLGRGKGLLIVKKIMAGYDNLLLNSYFTDRSFVQSLLIIKSE